MALAFINSPLNRSSSLRLDKNGLAELRTSSETRLLRVRDDLVEIEGTLPRIGNDGGATPAIFLGLAPAGQAWFACLAEERANLVPLRGLMLGGVIEPQILSMLAQARSLIHWHERHGFCAHCGAATVMVDAGYRRHCEGCGTDHFPRTDPVVIMVARSRNRLLLGRQASWAEGMYSALAGFMEPGETIEDAARREVMEEAGIRVGKITYVASQPWPYPSSLMIGLIGEAETEHITIDTTELQDARWFAASEIRAMLARNHGDGLHASNPYAIAHHLIARAVHGD